MKNKKQIEGKKLEEKLRKRKFMLDKQFQFAPENIEKIKDFSEALLQKTHELFDKISNIKRNFDLQIGSKDDSCLINEHYFICGNISIDSDKKELCDVVNRQQHIRLAQVLVLIVSIEYQLCWNAIIGISKIYNHSINILFMSVMQCTTSSLMVYLP